MRDVPLRSLINIENWRWHSLAMNLAGNWITRQIKTKWEKPSLSTMRRLHRLRALFYGAQFTKSIHCLQVQHQSVHASHIFESIMKRMLQNKSLIRLQMWSGALFVHVCCLNDWSNNISCMIYRLHIKRHSQPLIFARIKRPDETIMSFNDNIIQR